MRIFIHTHYLEIDGTATALIGLLEHTDPARDTVDLFLNERRGALLAHVPQWVRVLPELPAYAHLERRVALAIARGHWAVAAARLWAKVVYACQRRRLGTGSPEMLYATVGRITSRVLPAPTRQEYDLAISWLSPHDTVLRHIRARRKVCWIHTDYSRVAADRSREEPVWLGFDKIVAISGDVERTFLRAFPAAAGRTVVRELDMPEAYIRRRADGPRPADMPAEAGTLTLLTTGRYSQQKHLDIIPRLWRLLRDSGVSTRWYVIAFGAGEEERKFMQARAEEGAEEGVVVLGKRDNPYPYFRHADCYVQPSRWEGKSIAVREAQLLHTPVIITAYPTAASQIQDGRDGWIVPMQPEAAAERMARILGHAVRQKPAFSEDNV